MTCPEMTMEELCIHDDQEELENLRKQMENLKAKLRKTVEDFLNSLSPVSRTAAERKVMERYGHLFE